MHFPSFLAPAAMLAVAVAAAPAEAAEVRAFSPQAFAAAQAQGRPILIDVYADWCPTCRRQEPMIAELVAAPAYRDLIVFKLNFDEQKDDWRRLGVRRQSTLIAFSGRNETGRSVGDTNRDSLARLIRSTLG